MEMGGSFLNLKKIPNHLQKELNVLKIWDKIKRKNECKVLSNAGMYSKESAINWMLGKKPHQEVQSEQSEVSQAEAACGSWEMQQKKVHHRAGTQSSLNDKSLGANNWDIQSASSSLRTEIARCWDMENWGCFPVCKVNRLHIISASPNCHS